MQDPLSHAIQMYRRHLRHPDTLDCAVRDMYPDRSHEMDLDLDMLREFTGYITKRVMPGAGVLLRPGHSRAAAARYFAAYAATQSTVLPLLYPLAGSGQGINPRLLSGLRSWQAADVLFCEGRMLDLLRHDRAALVTYTEEGCELDECVSTLFQLLEKLSPVPVLALLCGHDEKQGLCESVTDLEELQW